MRGFKIASFVCCEGVVRHRRAYGLKINIQDLESQVDCNHGLL